MDSNFINVDFRLRLIKTTQFDWGDKVKEFDQKINILVLSKFQKLLDVNISQVRHVNHDPPLLKIFKTVRVNFIFKNFSFLFSNPHFSCVIINRNIKI